MSDLRFACPCCGFLTLKEEPPGTFAICPVCYWEDDDVQFSDPSYSGGANGISLEAARINYKVMGAVTSEYIHKVRAPFPEEKPI